MLYQIHHQVHKILNQERTVDKGRAPHLSKGIPSREERNGFAESGGSAHHRLHHQRSRELHGPRRWSARAEIEWTLRPLNLQEDNGTHGPCWRHWLPQVSDAVDDPLWMSPQGRCWSRVAATGRGMA